ncbi:TolC family protein [Conchiformibius kuhniae]|uniref:TolC family protein n=1 Tax=Conchiformibius kuhniae TaxID=211502 RepID=A0A8T9MXW3_9NEIS|nr:TolC family protein [Conchiformibius kuhniae]
MKPVFPLIALVAAAPAAAQNLQNVVREALSKDPAVIEANADAAAAADDIRIAQAGHYPTLSLTGTQTLLHRDRSGRERKYKLNPGLQATLNLYAWGGVDAKVRQSRHKFRYHRHKTDEVAGEVGHEAGTLYLAALRAKELIQTARHNLQRHHAIIKDLQIITRHDKGRLSELDQAQARRLQVEAYLAEQTRILELSLSRLGRYTGTRIAPQSLNNPFVRDTPDSLVTRFRRPDLAQLPGYQAQAAERESVLAEGAARKSSRYPSINLIAGATRDNREIYLNLSWDVFNPAAHYEVKKNAHTLVAAEAKMDALLRDSAERGRSAEMDMRQSLKRAGIAQQQIAAQKKVIKAYELQFKIARRTLIDVLDAYSDLSNIELTEVAAQNDFRDAAWTYLASQGAVAQWAQAAPPAAPAEPADFGAPLRRWHDKISDTLRRKTKNKNKTVAQTLPDVPAGTNAAPARTLREPNPFSPTAQRAWLLGQAKKQKAQQAAARPAVKPPKRTDAAPPLLRVGKAVDFTAARSAPPVLGVDTTNAPAFAVKRTPL